MARVYAGECSNTNITVNSFDPGPSRTALRAQAMPGEDEWSLNDPSEVAQELVKLVRSGKGETGKLYSFQKKAFQRYRKPS